MDYHAYCEMFYAAHYLPVAVYEERRFLSPPAFMRIEIHIRLFCPN